MGVVPLPQSPPCCATRFLPRKDKPNTDSREGLSVFFRSLIATLASPASLNVSVSRRIFGWVQSAIPPLDVTKFYTLDL